MQRIRHTPLQVCGILFCFNEEHILSYSLEHYLAQGIDLVIYDNYSTDTSYAVAVDFQKNKRHTYSGVILDIIRVETTGYEWKKILHHACIYMHAHLDHYAWIMLIDADAFYRSPIKNMSLVSYISITQKNGYNILNGQLFDFLPTDQDNAQITSPLQRMKHYRTYAPKLGLKEQHKIFAYDPSVDFYSLAGHICKRNNPCVSPMPFLYHHYSYVSFEHGIQKIFTQRKPRYTIDQRRAPHEHPQYMGILPTREDLIYSAYTLHHYKPEALLKPYWYYVLILRCAWIITLWQAVQQYSTHIHDLLRTVTLIYTYDPHALLLHWQVKIKKRLLALFRMHRSTSQEPICTAHTSYRVTTLHDAIKQQPCAHTLPTTYHFLMTNSCNASCHFCNQTNAGQTIHHMSLETFRVMVSHLELPKGTNFIFSGGGEPLLAPDIFAIIHYVHTELPWIQTKMRTNGLCIMPHAQRLAASGLHCLEISIHAASSERNDAIIGVHGTYDIFDGIQQLQDYLKTVQKNMRITLCPVLSQNNIDEIPAIITRAAQLRIYGVSVSFMLYFDNEPAQSSLFYDQKHYDTVITRARKQARSLGIVLTNQPLFSSPKKRKPCLQPWNTLVVDWNGNVFPCTGGEATFRKHIEDGTYSFGNLITEHITDFWNNEMYTKIRRTCNILTEDIFVPECTHCHNALCLNGPHDQISHIIE